VIYFHTELMEEAHNLQELHQAAKVFMLAAPWELISLRHGPATIMDMMRDPSYNAETILE
jgi:hypothetical protein